MTQICEQICIKNHKKNKIELEFDDSHFTVNTRTILTRRPFSIYSILNI